MNFNYGTTPKKKRVKATVTKGGITSYGAVKTNTVAGSSRQGSQYRLAYDDAGNIFHVYAAEAGGIPREVVKVSGRRRSNSPRSTL